MQRVLRNCQNCFQSKCQKAPSGELYGKDITQSESDEVTAVFSHKQPVPQPDIESGGYTGLGGVMVRR
jgi:hypothetical protein